MNGCVFFGIVVVMASFAQFAVDAFGGPVTGAGVDADGAPRAHCGVMDNWSAYMTDLGTLNSETPHVFHVQLDYNRSLQAMLNYTGSETPVNKLVIDYNADLWYFVHNDYCHKIPFSMPLLRQFPEDAEYLGSSYLGPLGAGQLDYDVWRVSAVKGQTQVVFTVALSRDGCVPLVEGVAFPGAPNQNRFYMFAGFQPSMTDPSAFTLPESCFQ